MSGSALLIDAPSGRVRVTAEEGTLRVGRDPLCRIVVDDPRVSREHVEISNHEGRWRLQDLGSSNGTYAGDGKVGTLDLVAPCSIRLGDAADGPLLELAPEAPLTPPPSTVTAGPPPTMAAEAYRAAFGLGPAAGATPPTPATQPAPAQSPASPAPAPTSPAPAPQPATVADPAWSSAARYEAGRTPSARHRPAERVTIGRAPDNNIVIDDLMVSRYHAQLSRAVDGLQLTDLDTRNGSFVNGQRVRHVTLRPGDLLSIGHRQFTFDGRELREYVDTGRISLRAEALTVTVDGGKQLLRGVSFSLRECSLLAVVGPSGAGKSTLLGALTGSRPAGQGKVVYEGRDLYAEYDELRQRIGLVPQEDILHRQLTVRRALRYAAALRFGSDVTPAEREQRIDEVIDQLGLRAHADQRIDTLSGGQRKRTSVALELLTEPSLLYLDEPTSGLDPALDRDVMVGLRDLADRGRTVVVVTHSPLHLNVCDQVLVLGRGGVVAYFGPPAGVLPFFGAKEYADVFKQVYDEPDAWAARYAATVAPKPPGPGSPGLAVPPAFGGPSRFAPPGFTAHLGGPGAPGPAGAASRAGAPPSRQGWIRQLSILTRRMAAVTLSDRMYAALLLGLPLGLAALLHVIPGDDGFVKPDGALGRSAEASQLLVVLIIGAVFMGLAGGVRELVGERAIYRRERAVGLAPGAYLASKLLVFSLVTAVQAVVFTTIGLIGRPLPDDALVLPWPLLELIAAVWLTALSCTALGLLVSAYVSTGEQTMPILVGLVMTQLVLSGGLFEVVGRSGIEEFSWLAPSRWGYAAAAATVDLREIMADPSDDALWKHTSGAWAWAMSVLALQGVLLSAATRLALRRHEPGR